jgi:chemotaxis-related protein WspD
VNMLTQPNLPAKPVQATPASTAPVAPDIHDCWNQIGVSGDRTCPELAKFIHCRNCPTYSAAGVRLLNHPVPPEYQREWTAHFAEPKKLVAAGRISVVIFRVGPEWLALPTRVLQEVAERRSIHSLPHRRHGVVLGLVNIRGELVICVSVGRLLSPERKTVTNRVAGNRLLVANWSGHRLAFPVDEVAGIHRYHPEDLRAAPTTVAKSSPTCVEGVLSWRDHSVGCLDEELFFVTLNRSFT